VHIRRGRLTREQGLEIVKLHDGRFPWTYLGKSIETILGPIGLTVNEFQDICDSFTNRAIFKSASNGNLIRRDDGSPLKINFDN
jgi:hypothetical protein